MSSPDESSHYLDVSSHHKGLSRSGSLSMDKSRSRSYLTKDISIDEGDALKKISEEVLLGGNLCKLDNFVCRLKRSYYVKRGRQLKHAVIITKREFKNRYVII